MNWQHYALLGALASTAYNILSARLNAKITDLEDELAAMKRRAKFWEIRHQSLYGHLTGNHPARQRDAARVDAK